jgi:hypothetical protein
MTPILIESLPAAWTEGTTPSRAVAPAAAAVVVRNSRREDGALALGSVIAAVSPWTLGMGRILDGKGSSGRLLGARGWARDGLASHRADRANRPGIFTDFGREAPSFKLWGGKAVSVLINVNRYRRRTYSSGIPDLSEPIFDMTDVRLEG